MSKNSMSSVQFVGLIALVVFVVALVLLLVAGGFGVIASIFMALLIALLTAIIAYLMLGPDSLGTGAALPHVATKSAPAKDAPATAAPVVPAAALASTPPAEAEAEVRDVPPAAEPETPVSVDAVAEDPEPAPMPEAEPAPEAEPTPAAAAGEDYDGDGKLEGTGEGTRPAGIDAPRDGEADDLKQIKGVGPKLEKLLNSMGFWHFDQVAAWSSDEVAWVDANLTGFKGRVSRDNWIDQAKVLASGGETEFSKRVEDGDVY